MVALVMLVALEMVALVVALVCVLVTLVLLCDETQCNTAEIFVCKRDTFDIMWI